MLLVTLLAAITVIFSWNLQFLAFDFEFEKFFPKDHPETLLYQEHVAQFGYDNDFLHLILEHEPSVFDTSFLRRASAFEASLNEIEDVEQAYSPLSLQHVVKSPTGLVIFPLMRHDDPGRLLGDSTRIFGNAFYRAAFSTDAKAVSIYLHHAHFDDPVRSERLLTKIEENAERYQLGPIRLVGKLSASGVFIQYIQEDFGTFLVGSLLLSFGLLLIIFRNLKSAFLPFLISLISIVWMFGLMGLLGFKINLLSSLIPPILFFVSMSDAVHLLNALTKHSSKQDTLEAALRIVWTPTLLTSVTTAVGFLSLLWISTEPIQHLGLFAAIGIVFAFIITFTVGLLIASVTNFPEKGARLRLPEKYTRSLFRHAKAYQIVLVVLVAVMLPGVLQLKVDAFLLHDLPSDSQVRQDFAFADSALGGSKPYEIRVEVADSTKHIWDQEVMDEIVKIEDYLLQEYPVSKVQSPATIIKYLTMANRGGLNENYQYPESEKEYAVTLRLKNRIDPKRMDKLVTEDSKVARLIGFIPELGSRETERRNQQLLADLGEKIDASLITFNITGTTYLIDKSHEMLSRNLLAGLLTAIGIIGLILGLYFKSWRLLLISLIPNLIPLLMVAGIIGWLGIPIQMTTAIIFAIAFSIAVDDTIHLMSNYMQSSISNPQERVGHTLAHAGNAVLITSLTMCAGFCLFLFSSFGATFYMGLFITISLVMAVVVDLTLLPILLTSYFSKVSR